MASPTDSGAMTSVTAPIALNGKAIKAPNPHPFNINAQKTNDTIFTFMSDPFTNTSYIYHDSQ
jgi:hypothetical protein